VGPDVTLKQLKSRRSEKSWKCLSQLFSAFIQAFFLSQSLFLVVAGHRVNFDAFKIINRLHYALLIPSVLLLTALILFARYKKLRITKRLTFHAWLIYGAILAAMTTQASVVLGILLVTVAMAFYTRRDETIYLPIYVYLIVMFTVSMLKHGHELPTYFGHLPDFPMMSVETIASFIIFLPILCMALAWHELNRSAKNLIFSSDKMTLITYRIILITCLLIHIVWAGWYLTLRLRVFAASTYDMGIFTQMYHYMSRTGLPLTTLERDTLLSHFKVHISPILYVLLPVFKLFPSALTVQISQVVLTATGVFPAYLLAKQYGLSKKARLVWTSLYLLLPGILFGSFYDFHENVFLSPILLFLIYFVAKGNLAGTVVFSLLTLMVKEDAFLYLAAVALFLLFSSKDKKSTAFTRKTASKLAIVILFVGALCFLMALSYLSNHGLGPMTSRFDNFVGIPKLGILSIIPTVFLNFTLFIETLFVKSKMGYIFIVMTSLGFIPLLNRKFHRLFLWVPFIVINLMSNYEYQYRIDFQYNYGSHVLLFALALLTYADYAEAFPSKKSIGQHDKACGGVPSPVIRRITTKDYSQRNRTMVKRAVISSLVLLALVASFVQTTLLMKKRMNRINLIGSSIPPYSETITLLDKIPRDSIVVADGYFTVPLADIEQLYDAMYYNWKKDRPRPDYLVLRRTAFYDYAHYNTMLLSGYREVGEMSSDWLLVMKREN